MAQTAEKMRRAKRISKRINSCVEIEGRVLSGIFTDFSVYGCFIRTSQLLAIQTPVNIWIVLSPGKEIRLSGRVVSRLDELLTPLAFNSGMGIEFTATPEEYSQFVSAQQF